MVNIKNILFSNVTMGIIFIKMWLEVINPYKYTNIFMISERQKYVSGILKSLGFALFAPAGSIVFQQMVFQKALFNYFKEAVLVFLLGWIFMIGGFVALREK